MGALLKREVVYTRHAAETASGELPARTPASGQGQLAAVLTTPVGPNLSVKDQAVAEQRFAIIEPLISPDKFGLLWIECGRKKGAVVRALSARHEVKRSTIYSWLSAFQNGGVPALVNKDRSDRGKPRSLNNAALEFLLTATMPLRGSYGLLSLKEIFRAYGEEREWRAKRIGKRLSEPEARKYARYLDEDGCLSPDASLPGASYATFNRWSRRIPSTLRVHARGGEKAFADTQEIISSRDLTALSPLDYVVMDHRRLDLFCLVQQSGGWKLIRPWLTAAIDMRTRKWLAWDIVESPSSDSIASVLKQIFLKYGLPGAVYWDNGKDFRCEWFEGRNHQSRQEPGISELSEGVRGVLETLNVRVHHAIVRRARSKIIEPNFVNTANFDRSLPTWCGHKPDARPERFSELVSQHERWLKGEAGATPFRTIAEIAWLYDQFLEKDLNERDHAGEGMQKVTPSGHGWMCPNECWERLIGGVARRWAPPEVIQFCFRKRRESTVRSGEIRVTFSGQAYHYRMLDDPTKLMSLNGNKVEMAYDSHDLETVAVYHDGRFIGLAANLELRKMGEQTFVEDERLRRASRREVKQFIQNAHTSVHVASAEERALRRIAVVPERQEPQRIGAQSAVAPDITKAVEAVRSSVRIEVIAPVPKVDDDEFKFFE